MKRNDMYNKSKKKRNFKKARITILFTAVALFVIAASAVMAQKFSTSRQAAQAISTNEQTNSDSGTNNEENKTANNTVSNKENSGEVEDVAFIEKYLAQQMKGQKPDGADGKKVVYLTFDDGPSETVTPQVLSELKAENVHATFFLIGKYIDKSDKSKDLVKQEVADGNAVGIHSYTHDYNYLYPNNKINLNNCMSDFEKTNQSLKNVLGQDFTTRAIRFPGGQMTWEKQDPKGAEAIDNAIHDKDWHQVDWNALSGDAEGKPKNAQQLTDEAIKTIGKREKVVLLMHDTYGKEETAKSLPGIIKYLKDNGYEFKILK